MDSGVSHTLVAMATFATALCSLRGTRFWRRNISYVWESLCSLRGAGWRRQNNWVSSV